MRIYSAQKEIPADLSVAFLAWAAGFVDGEGCIRAHVTRNDNTGPVATPTTTRLRLVVGQKVREPLDLLCDGFGVGGVYQRRLSRLYIWNVNTRQAEQVIRALLPYLVVKKADALASLDAAGYSA